MISGIKKYHGDTIIQYREKIFRVILYVRI